MEIQSAPLARVYRSPMEYVIIYSYFISYFSFTLFCFFFEITLKRYVYLNNEHFWTCGGYTCKVGLRSRDSNGYMPLFPFFPFLFLIYP